MFRRAFYLHLQGQEVWIALQHSPINTHDQWVTHSGKGAFGKHTYSYLNAPFCSCGEGRYTLLCGTVPCHGRTALRACHTVRGVASSVIQSAWYTLGPDWLIFMKLPLRLHQKRRKFLSLRRIGLSVWSTDDENSTTPFLLILNYSSDSYEIPYSSFII
jgi:hypothetical protein